MQVPVPSDQDGHDHAAVAQNGEQDDDGEVDDPALLAFLHAGATLPAIVREEGDLTSIEKGVVGQKYRAIHQVMGKVL